MSVVFATPERLEHVRDGGITDRDEIPGRFRHIVGRLRHPVQETLDRIREPPPRGGSTVEHRPRFLGVDSLTLGRGFQERVALVFLSLVEQAESEQQARARPGRLARGTIRDDLAIDGRRRGEILLALFDQERPLEALVRSGVLGREPSEGPEWNDTDDPTGQDELGAKQTTHDELLSGS